MSFNVSSPSENRKPNTQSLLSSFKISAFLPEDIKGLDTFQSLSVIYTVIIGILVLWSFLYMLIMLTFLSQVSQNLQENQIIRIWTQVFRYFALFGATRSLYGVMQFGTFAYVGFRKTGITRRTLKSFMLFLVLSLAGLFWKYFVVFSHGNEENELINQIFTWSLGTLLLRHSFWKDFGLFSVEFGLFLAWFIFAGALNLKIKRKMLENERDK